MPWHSCREAYKVGDSIRPGRWGSVILATGATHPAWTREQTFERVRRLVAPNAPSRLAAAFAHVERTDAIGYAEAGHHIYEVASHPAAIVRDMVWVTWVRESLDIGDVAKAERQAALYWHGEFTRNHLPQARPHWEVISSQPLRVLGLLSVSRTGAIIRRRPH